jgi:BirA family biotin operon repressor/biotin-[acetyl-CoA-carboxylase] ligase
MPRECLSLVGLLADGEHHSLSALAMRVFDRVDAGDIERIVDALVTFQELGMPLVCDGNGARARRFIPLQEQRLRQALPHWQVRVSGSTDSTNTELLGDVRAAATPTCPIVLASEIQRAGRGRLGRHWTSAPGASLTASFALRVQRRLSALDGVTLVCGLAVRDAVTAHGVDATLKWPNDVLCDGHKLGGVLVEAHAIDSASVAIVVGVGINVAPRAHVDVAMSALPPTDLASCGGHALDRNRITSEIAIALKDRLELFARAGFAAFVDEWNTVDAFHDREVLLGSTTARPDEARRGIARGVDDSGALLLEIDGACTRIVSGDVSLRAAEDKR